MYVSYFIFTYRPLNMACMQKEKKMYVAMIHLNGTKVRDNLIRVYE